MDDEPKPEGGDHGKEPEEPVIVGTVVLTTVLLMLIFGFWVMMYIELLGR
ncbi:MAG: cytochrome c oxidase subunit 2A [Thermoanaerobaculia bacterium]|nr:cytochrome c oxidase subunit 2A [Thermoanaerobaculia bacterium]